MSQMLVQYRTHADKTQDNETLVSQVFRELEASRAEGVRYLCLKLDDGTFVHFVNDEANVITGLAAFQAFRRNIAERCVEPPKQIGATVVGNYRMIIT